MSERATEIEVTFEESPRVEIQPINRSAHGEKRKVSWLAWLR